MASLLFGNKKYSTIDQDSTPSKEHTRLVLSPSTSGESSSSPSSTSSSTLSSSLRNRLFNYSTIIVVMAGLLAAAAISSFTSSTSSSLDSSLLSSASKDGVVNEHLHFHRHKPWPTDVYSSIGSASNPYKGTGELGSSSFLSTGRPTTTKEAAANGWKPLQLECVTELGYPWAFDGTITEGAPVTLYYSKLTRKQDGVLTGMAVHYYDGVAPEKMIGTIFSKGTEYETIQVTFRDENTDVCRRRSLPSNQPYVAVLLADDGNNPKGFWWWFRFFFYRNPKTKRGRQLLPLTTDAAVASGDWVAGSCVPNMGTHWMRDIETDNDTLSYEAKNLYPVTTMYDPKDGALVAIFFSATKYMQASPVTLPPDNTVSNLWDVSHLLQSNNGPPPNLMCINFCDPQCQFTGGLGEPPAFSSMHWWFGNPAEISTCTTNIVLSDKCKPENFPVIG